MREGAVSFPEGDDLALEDLPFSAADHPLEPQSGIAIVPVLVDHHHPAGPFAVAAFQGAIAVSTMAAPAAIDTSAAPIAFLAFPRAIAGWASAGPATVLASISIVVAASLAKATPSGPFAIYAPARALAHLAIAVPSTVVTFPGIAAIDTFSFAATPLTIVPELAYEVVRLP